jgi:hypothetical protein
MATPSYQQKPVVIFLDRPRRVVVREISSNPTPTPKPMAEPAGQTAENAVRRKVTARLKRLHPMD